MQEPDRSEEQCPHVSSPKGQAGEQELQELPPTIQHENDRLLLLEAVLKSLALEAVARADGNAAIPLLEAGIVAPEPEIREAAARGFGAIPEKIP